MPYFSGFEEESLEVTKMEARSISQICEIFLRLGVEGYEREGSKFLQRFSRPPEERKSLRIESSEIADGKEVRVFVFRQHQAANPDA